MYEEFTEIDGLKDRGHCEQLTLLLQKNNLIRFGRNLDTMFETRRSNMYTVDRANAINTDTASSNNNNNTIGAQ